MRITTQEPFAQNGFFALQDQNWLDKQRRAGRIAAKTLNHLEKLVLEKTTCSLIELSNIAEQMIIQDGAIPTFKGYRGFPAAVCISVNEQLVHGIPTDYKLKDGDIVSFDVGVTCDGAIADTAITCIYGNPKQEWHVKLISATQEALYKGISAIAVDKRLGCIGQAIHKSAKANGFSIITKYGGHGLSWNTPHAPPFVDNKSEIDQGFRIQPGLVIAIEPMLVQGVTDTYTAADGWTVMTKNISAHMEHSVFVHADHVEIITDRSKL